MEMGEMSSKITDYWYINILLSISGRHNCGGHKEGGGGGNYPLSQIIPESLSIVIE
jgi:hypothetical protein